MVVGVTEMVVEAGAAAAGATQEARLAVEVEAVGVEGSADCSTRARSQTVRVPSKLRAHQRRCAHNLTSPALTGNPPFSFAAAEERRKLVSSIRARARADEQAFDASVGYARLESGPMRTAYLFNMCPSVMTADDGSEFSALDCFFLEQNGDTFKASVLAAPYLYVTVLAPTEMGGGAAVGAGGAGLTYADAPEGAPVNEREREVQAALERALGTSLGAATWVERQDLGLLNHLAGRGAARLLRLAARTSGDLQNMMYTLRPIVEKNSVLAARGESLEAEAAASGDPLRLVTEMREYDVPFMARVAIDFEIRCGKWYNVTPIPPVAAGSGVSRGAGVGTSGGPAAAVRGIPVPSSPMRGLSRLEALAVPPNVHAPRVCAFDIECTKAPLKFPDAATDSVYMISYMTDGQGFLLVNREVVSEDVPDFEYTPLDEYPGPFTVVNLANEGAMLRHWLEHMRELRVNIFVTYNGDYFDWPFLDARVKVHGLSIKDTLGIAPVASNGRELDAAGAGVGGGGADVEWRGRTAVHIDCLYWVKRDSFLPQGSHGLKSVAADKLRYDPVEIDPEDMLRLAAEDPRRMASYSVSDAVATYYLYMKYIHSFVFSLASIIPLAPDDVLRKGSGTLCEMLLMAEAFRGGIVCPNKQRDSLDPRHDGHLLDSETYLGGHVECLESGVFRSDIPTNWNLHPPAFDALIRDIDKVLTFFIEVEKGAERADVVNYEDVRGEIIERLELLRDAPDRVEAPRIYHLDVAAMYPNIILSNRLQPQAMVTPDTCAACDFAQEPNARCQRPMDWKWRGEYFPASAEETTRMRNQLENETFTRGEVFGRKLDNDLHPFLELPPDRQLQLLKQRLRIYSQKAYKRMKDTVELERSATVCQRENPFYVDTVRAFRDRRYEFKMATKVAMKKLEKARAGGDRLEIESAKATWELNDSLQLAHKVILNSFYGYVMRKGARWHSMEMAGVVTYTGSKLIQGARRLVEQVGRPLELDTDGIWCILPASFPQRFTLRLRNGDKLDLQYPCAMLNVDVHENYTNHQYQDKLGGGGAGQYGISSECSIFFELDGPHRAMIIPTSQDEDRMLKKRYAVFDDDGEMTELKGFELKRRGELKMIKLFQTSVFKSFLRGTDLVSCYTAVAETADFWLNVLDTQGEDLTDEEIVDFFSENKSMSKSIEEYGERKSVAISTAQRLAELLGRDVIREKGISCRLLIAKKPVGAPIASRAIPATIFSSEDRMRRHFLGAWLREAPDADFDIRAVLDWDYYRARLASVIQKIITIPAAMQKVANPVPRVPHPDWLLRKLRVEAHTHKQMDISKFLVARPPATTHRDHKGVVAPGTALRTAQRAPRTAGDVEDLPPGIAAMRALSPPRVVTGAGVGGVSVAPDATGLRSLTTGAGFSSPGRGRRGDSALQSPFRSPTRLLEVRSPASSRVTPARAAEAASVPAVVAAPPPVASPGSTGRPRILAAPPVAPNTELDDLVGWAASRREMWAAARADRRRRLATAAPVVADDDGDAGPRFGRLPPPKGSKAALALAATAAASRTSNATKPGVGYLQIVEVRPDLTAPGEFTVWAFTAPRRLASFRLSASRILYLARRRPLNSSDAISEIARLAPDRTLPRDEAKQYLYELCVPERRFQDNRSVIARASTDVLGVYGASAPLAFTLLLSGIGAVAQVSTRRESAQRAADSPPAAVASAAWRETLASAATNEQQAAKKRARRAAATAAAVKPAALKQATLDGLGSRLSGPAEASIAKIEDDEMGGQPPAVDPVSDERMDAGAPSPRITSVRASPVRASPAAVQPTSARSSRSRVDLVYENGAAAAEVLGGTPEGAPESAALVDSAALERFDSLLFALDSQPVTAAAEVGSGVAEEKGAGAAASTDAQHSAVVEVLDDDVPMAVAGAEAGAHIEKSSAPPRARRKRLDAVRAAIAARPTGSAPGTIEALFGIRSGVASAAARADGGAVSAGSPRGAALSSATVAPALCLGDLEMLSAASHSYLDPIAGTPLARLGLPGVSAIGAAAATGGAAREESGASAVFRVAFLHHSRPVAGEGASTARALTALFVISETNAESALAAAEIVASGWRDQLGEGSTAAAIPFPEDIVATLRDIAGRSVPGIDTPITVTAHVWAVALGAARGDQLSRKLLASRHDSLVAEHGLNSANTMDFRVRATRERQDTVWTEVATLLNSLSPSAPGAGPTQRKLPPLILHCSYPPTSPPPPSVIACVPCVHVPLERRADAFPQMGWTDNSSTYALTDFYASRRWWMERISTARSTGVPVASLSNLRASATGGSAAAGGAIVSPEQDAELMGGVADLYFARALTASRHVLWLSASAVPDLGGAEAAAGLVKTMAGSAAGAAASAAALATAVPGLYLTGPSGDALGGGAAGNNISGSVTGGSLRRSTALATALTGLLPPGNPQLAAPGMYRSVCYELSVSDLALNTILVAGIFDMGLYDSNGGGGGGDGADGDGDVSTAPASARGSAWPAFRVLQRVVKSWLAEYSATNSDLSRELMKRLYPWLVSSSSLLYDPALVALVRDLSSRVFALLLRSLRSSNLTIIFAAYDRIIVSTGKRDVAAGLAAVQRAVKRLGEDPQLVHISFSATRSYSTLAFLDRANFCGIVDRALIKPERAEETSAHTPSAAELAEVWSSRLVDVVRDTLIRMGRPPNEAGWRALGKEFVAHATRAYEVDSKWAMADALSQNAGAYHHGVRDSSETPDLTPPPPPFFSDVV